MQYSGFDIKKRKNFPISVVCEESLRPQLCSPGPYSQGSRNEDR